MRRTNKRKKNKQQITDMEAALFLFVSSFVKIFAGINRKPLSSDKSRSPGFYTLYH